MGLTLTSLSLVAITWPQSYCYLIIFMLDLQTLTSAVVEVQLFSKSGSCAFFLFCSPPNPRLSVPLSSAAATERLSARYRDLAPDVTSSHLITRYGSLVPRLSLLRAISTRMTFDPARKGEIFPRDRRHVSIPNVWAHTLGITQFYAAL